MTLGQAPALLTNILLDLKKHDIAKRSSLFYKGEQKFYKWGAEFSFRLDEDSSTIGATTLIIFISEI